MNLARRNDLPLNGLRLRARLLLYVLATWFVFALATPAAVSAAERGTAPLEHSFFEWVQSNNSISYSALAARFVTASGGNADTYKTALATLQKELNTALRGSTDSSAKSRSQLLATFLFKTQGFSADLDLEQPENLFPDEILTRKRGYCLGLSLLVLHLTEQLNWPLTAVSAPRHTFIRYRDAKGSINIETTQSGALHADGWYASRFDFTSGKKNVLHELTPRQLAAHLFNNHGFVLLARGHTKAAKIEFRRALQLHSELIEATTNLGVAAARDRAYKQALSYFDTALIAWPGDPHLLLNRANTLLGLDQLAEACTTVGQTLIIFVAAGGLRFARRQTQGPSASGSSVEAAPTGRHREQRADGCVHGQALRTRGRLLSRRKAEEPRTSAGRQGH